MAVKHRAKQLAALSESTAATGSPREGFTLDKEVKFFQPLVAAPPTHSLNHNPVDTITGHLHTAG